MAHSTYSDIRAFCTEHPKDTHDVVVVATDQVVMVCYDCGFSMTVDACDAGLPVKHPTIEEVAFDA